MRVRHTESRGMANIKIIGNQGPARIIFFVLDDLASTVLEDLRAQRSTSPRFSLNRIDTRGAVSLDSEMIVVVLCEVTVSVCDTVFLVSLFSVFFSDCKCAEEALTTFFSCTSTSLDSFKGVDFLLERELDFFETAGFGDFALVSVDDASEARDREDRRMREGDFSERPRERLRLRDFDDCKRKKLEFQTQLMQKKPLHYKL